MIILDTNVISALMRPRSHLDVVAWLNDQPRSSIWTTSISLLETRYGLHLMPRGRKRDELTAGFESLLRGILAGRLLPFDVAAAEEAAALFARRTASGRNIEVRDTQIAGIAISRNASLATRNTRHFDDLDLRLVNPWEG